MSELATPAASTVTESGAAAARAIVEARRAAHALPGYPGTPPADVPSAYAIQDAAIAAWPDRIVGWKIGKVPPAVQQTIGATRLAGPIFASTVQVLKEGEVGAFAAIPGGFAAVEAEVIYRLAKDAPVDRTEWSVEEALDLVADMHIGIEPAGCPLKTVNDLGPLVVISAYGNNAGLFVGPAIPGWRDREPATLTCATFVNGEQVGTGVASSLEGGPAGCFAWLLGQAASRGYPLKAGDFVTTGQLSGIHDVVAGDTALIDFGPLGQVRCTVSAARPTT